MKKEYIIILGLCLASGILLGWTIKDIMLINEQNSLIDEQNKRLREAYDAIDWLSDMDRRIAEQNKQSNFSHDPRMNLITISNDGRFIQWNVDCGCWEILEGRPDGILYINMSS